MKYSEPIYQVLFIKKIGLRIIECVPEDFKYFINLEDLDISENEILLE